MSDIIIRTDGFAGLITLNRPDALNALTWQMLLEIETALDQWRGDPTVKLVLIDGAGDRAFCAGGDIAEMYATGMRGEYDYGRRFWRDEYRLNAKIARYPAARGRDWPGAGCGWSTPALPRAVWRRCLSGDVRRPDGCGRCALSRICGLLHRSGTLG